MSDLTGANRTALLIGGSRGLGLALVGELVERGWTVIATVRGERPQALEQLAGQSGDRLSIENLDMTEPAQIADLRQRLDGVVLDLLFVSAGITDEDRPVGEVSTDVFVKVMVTNALSPLRVVEGLEPLVKADGTIAVMSSRQGSISMNTRGGHEVYRASKSALNQLMRSYAARHQEDSRTLLLVNPGWVQTELGGEGAPLTVEQTVPGVVDMIEQHGGDGGLQFLDYEGKPVSW